MAARPQILMVAALTHTVEAAIPTEVQQLIRTVEAPIHTAAAVIPTAVPLLTHMAVAETRTAVAPPQPTLMGVVLILMGDPPDQPILMEAEVIRIPTDTIPTRMANRPAPALLAVQTAAVTRQILPAMNHLAARAVTGMATTTAAQIRRQLEAPQATIITAAGQTPQLPVAAILMVVKIPSQLECRPQLRDPTQPLRKFNINEYSTRGYPRVFLC